MNVLLKEQAGTVRVKICDLGLAREISTNPKADCGTMHYKAPEVFSQNFSGAYEKSADIFSLGLLLLQFINVKDNDEIALPTGRYLFIINPQGGGGDYVTQSVAHIRTRLVRSCHSIMYISYLIQSATSVLNYKEMF